MTPRQFVSWMFCGLCAAGSVSAETPPEPAPAALPSAPAAPAPEAALEPVDKGMSISANLLVQMLQVMPDESVRYVSPRKLFKSGDRFRLEVRASVDGFLYMFAQEPGGDLGQVYPPKGQTRKLARGERLVLPQLGAFQFDQKPGVEQLTLLLAKAPMRKPPESKPAQPLKTKDLVIEEEVQEKGILLAMPENRFGGADPHLVYTLELRHQ